MLRSTFFLVMLNLCFATWVTADDTKAKAQTDKPADSAAVKGAEVEELKFVQVVRENDQPVSLQTAVVTYKLGDSTDSQSNSKYAGVEVTLIGAIHIAEKSYYSQLNNLFKTYDALLYEMVSDPKVGVPEVRERGGSPVSSVQVGMKDMLELSFQLDEVNYKAANFVHADMSPEEFFESMQKRKEGVLQMLLRSIGSGLAMQGSGKTNDIDVLSAMLSDNRSQNLKRALAEQFETMEGQMAALQGDDGRSTLITERNAKAFRVLDEQIAAGKKKLAIFYGAGHLKDMHERLLQQYQMKPSDHAWLNAWDLK